MTSLLLRIKSSLILGPPFLLAVYMGGWMFFIVVAAVALAAASELLKTLSSDELDLPTGRWICFFSLVTLLVMVHFSHYTGLFYLPLGILVAHLIHCLLVRGNCKEQVSVLSWSMLTVAYIGLIGFWLAVRSHPEGLFFLLYALVSTWAFDIGAYFSGSKWGTQPLVPHLSPGKTTVGLFGGIFAAGIAGFAFSYWLPTTHIHGVLLAISLGIIAQLGDLFASLIKRSASVKDFSNLIPGHGGVLDRIDSLLFSVALLHLFVEVGLL